MSNASEKVIEIPAGFNLLESKAQGFVDDLLDAALEIHQKKNESPSFSYILLLQNEDSEDTSESFLEELTSELLLDELVLRIVKLQLLFYLIRTSRIPWIYAAQGRIFGSYLELAASCFHILASDPTLKVGFPAIDAGLFPWGGSIEHTLFRVMSVSTWSRTSTLPLGDLPYPRITTLQVAPSRWMRSLQNWLANQLMISWKRDFIPQTKDHRDNFNQLRKNYEAGLEGARFLRPEWVKDIEQSQNATSWDLSYGLIKKNKKEISLGDRFRLLAYIAARHMLSDNFIGWHRAAIMKKKIHLRVVSEPKVDIVFVDLHYVVPPAESLIRLLEKGMQVVFFTDDHEELRRGLELAFARVERARSLDEAQKLWAKGVSWFVSRPEQSYEPVLRWSADDKISFEHGKEFLEFIRIAGNRGRAPCGVSEWVTDGDKAQVENGEAFKILSLLSDALIITRPFPNALFSTSLFIRSFMFEELVRCAGIGQQEIVKVVEGLSATGWSALGSQGFWNRFLTSRHGIQPVDSRQFRVGRKILWPQAFDVGLWKEARALSVRSHGNDPLRSANPVILSQHFTILSGVIAALLIQNGLVNNLEEADALVFHSTGFPSDKGLPSSYLQTLGTNRVLTYVQRYWPELGPDIAAFLTSMKNPVILRS